MASDTTHDDPNYSAVSATAITPPPAPIKRELSETDKAKRALQRRYKAMFGYKPTGMTLQELSACVRREERAHGIVPVEETPATVGSVEEFAAKFRK
ncbi:MAG: hypothetical protein WC505_05685 [Patescibacteria group bacterium]